ncbi:flavin reductase (NADPH) [Daktulosphaira vitifoliae]|uniref:flavin reductase (NADPH) n=1 Tax=Daktulosphaira vitifoliae TaxID=58002 RepID=UPI0021AA5A62|nr:flavin reductase (NADPH) [Daktulosphaira vitifoliae]
MKKIAIFGSTGMTGLCTVEAALKQGLEVRALIRDPSRLPESLRNQIEVITGDVLVTEDVDKTVEGRDAIVVTLGTRNDLSPTTIMSDGLKNILSAMKKNNVKTVSVCLSTFLFYEKSKVPAMFHGINDDHERMLHLLESSEGLNWIAVMPPHIADTPSGDYNVEIGSSPGRAISKLDLAKFMVECLIKPDYYKQKVGLATKVTSP